VGIFDVKLGFEKEKVGIFYVWLKVSISEF